ARSADGAVARGEDDYLALGERHHFAAGLGARPLLDEQELATGEVGARTAAPAGHLQREGPVAVELLMQAVVAAGLVAEQQRRGFRLPVLGAHRQELVQVRRIRGL